MLIKKNAIRLMALSSTKTNVRNDKYYNILYYNLNTLVFHYTYRAIRFFRSQKLTFCNLIDIIDFVNFCLLDFVSLAIPNISEKQLAHRFFSNENLVKRIFEF